MMCIRLMLGPLFTIAWICLLMAWRDDTNTVAHFYISLKKKKICNDRVYYWSGMFVIVNFLMIQFTFDSRWRQWIVIGMKLYVLSRDISSFLSWHRDFFASIFVTLCCIGCIRLISVGGMVYQRDVCIRLVAFVSSTPVQIVFKNKLRWDDYHASRIDVDM